MRCPLSGLQGDREHVRVAVNLRLSVSELRTTLVVPPKDCAPSIVHLASFAVAVVEDSVGSRTLDQWALDGKFDPAMGNAHLPTADTVIELTSLPDFQEPMLLFEWAFLDGIAGPQSRRRDLALIHTFCNSSHASSPIAWAESEPSILGTIHPTPHFATAQPLGPPTTWSRDRRTCCFDVLCGESHWTYQSAGWTNGKWCGKSPPLLMVRTGRGGQIAATPIPLPVIQFGFFLRQKRREYSWYNIDLDQQSIEPWRGAPFKQFRCRSRVRLPSVDVPETPSPSPRHWGHWFWIQRDAVDSKVRALDPDAGDNESRSCGSTCSFTDPLSFSRRSQLIVEDNAIWRGFTNGLDDTGDAIVYLWTALHGRITKKRMPVT